MPRLFALACCLALLSACASRKLQPCTAVVCTTSQLHLFDATSHDATGSDTASSDAGKAQDAKAVTPGVGADSSVGQTTGTTGDSMTQRCARWTADRADLSEGGWTGAKATCEAGTLPAPTIENVLRMVNLARFLADLPAVTHAPDLDAHAQACSLLMAANGQLSHTPPPTWNCYTAEAANAAQHCNISTAPAVVSVQDYLIDSGNDDTLGHRRWILSNSLGPIGIGGTSTASCLWVIGGSGTAKRPWTAWPPPGAFPLAAMRDAWGSTLDQTGWSIQSDTLDLANAAVTVTSGGATLPVQARALKPYYGSQQAIAFTPEGWQAQAGTTYHVAVTGVSKPFAYDVQVVDCGK